MGDESSFPTTRVKGSSIVIISLYLDPGKGSGSSYSRTFPLITSSNNSEEITPKFSRKRTIPTKFQPGHFNIGAKNIGT